MGIAPLSLVIAGTAVLADQLIIQESTTFARRLMEPHHWKALGGPNLPLKIILVGGGGGVTVAVETELLKGQRASAPNIYAKTPVQLVQIVEQERAAMSSVIKATQQVAAEKLM